VTIALCFVGSLSFISPQQLTEYISTRQPLLASSDFLEFHFAWFHFWIGECKMGRRRRIPVVVENSKCNDFLNIKLVER
jgi:hypothetical protein